MEDCFALILSTVLMSACRAKVVVSDEFQDVRRTQFACSAAVVEREMVCLESFYCAECTGF